MHRYSTDRIWLHILKDVGDQAILPKPHSTLIITGKQEYANLVKELLSYNQGYDCINVPVSSVLKMLIVREEGKFYVWKPDEILQIWQGSGRAFLSNL